MRRLPSFVRPEVVFALVAVAGLALVFRGRFDGDFVWDDVYYVEHNAVLTRGPIRSFFTPAMWGVSPPPAQFYRPVTMLTVWLQTQMSGVSLPAFRTGSLLLHLVNVGLLVIWFRKQRIGSWIALLAAAAFAVHPSVCESIMWVMGRGDLLGTTFTLGALLVWRSTFGRAALAALLSALAFLSKESFVFVPILLGLAELHVRWRERAPRRSAGLRFVLLPVVADLGVVGLRSAVGVSTASSALRVGVAGMFRLMGTILDHYTEQLATWSNGATAENFELAPDMRVVTSWLALALFVIFLVAWARRGSSAAAGMLFGVLTFGRALAPLAFALPFTGMFGNRYAYFPLLAMMIVVAHAAAALVSTVNERAPRLLPVLAVAATAAVGLSGLSTSAEALPWHDAVTLFAYDAARSPHDPKALYHYAHALGAKSGCEQAIVYYERAVHADPTYTRAWHNLTGCLINLQRYDEAIVAGEHANELSSGAPRDEYNLGVALAGVGRRDEGLAHLERAVAREGSYAPARAALARLRDVP